MRKATTKTCSKCGIEKALDLFYSNGPGKTRSYCKECIKSLRRDRRAADPVAARRRDAKRRNPEYNRAAAIRTAGWREANPEKVKELNESNRMVPGNAELARVRQQAWHKANPEKSKINGQISKANHEDRTLSATIPGEVPVALDLKMILLGHKNLCYVCGDPWEHWDHVTPVSRGGLHHRSNLRPMCAPCNLSKGAKTLKEWL